jgi:tetratricopeptide (TPR) repeat protein
MIAQLPRYNLGVSTLPTRPEDDSMKPLCFVLMPFGKKTDETGRLIDFDQIYEQIIRPGIEAADLESIRDSEETTGGFIHKRMFERLMLCDYAVADLTTANPNVFYELGMRHGVRPHTTVLMSCRGMRLPFDIAPLRLIRYSLDASGSPTKVDADRDAVRSRLIACKNPVEDSPLFQLLTDWPTPDIARLKTDTFRESVDYSQKYKTRLAAARKVGSEALAQIESELDISTTDPVIVIDLFLSYRAAENWSGMVDLTSKMSPPMARSVLVREQTGLALNRLGKREEAEEVLLKLIEERGPSSETNGILGRVYKDSWKDNRTSGNTTAAIGYLRKAISAYVQGFEADWRDAYPGVNALTLMEINEPLDPRQAELLPVVHYSVKRRLATKRADYWDHAALLELAVLGKDRPGAESALADAIPAIRESWEPRSTANNLGMIREKRSERGEDVDWIVKIETGLEQAARAKDIHP